MSTTVHAAPLLRQVRHLIGAGRDARASDGQLLERFVAAGEEAAFEGLVRRYGPLVLGVCRRVLRDAHAAEDAFQATFLVLVRKAASLDRRQSLGGWLSTVAHRLALRARESEARRRRRETDVHADRVDATPPPPSDLAVAVEEELMRLPEKHRAPLVLCYLEGKTNEQAAEALGCPKGSIAWRLTQARELLRERLTRRGVAVGAATLAAALPGALAPAAVPAPLLRTTVQAALWFASEDAAGAASAQALALAQGALTAMISTKLKVVAGVLLLLGLCGGGVSLMQAADGQAASADRAAAAAPKSEASAGVVARLGSSRLRHGDAIFYAAYTPDGKSLLTASQDQTIRLWDVASGREVRRFDRPGEDKAAGLMMPAGGKGFMMRGVGINQNFAAALSRDGKSVVATRGDKIHVWETATGKKAGEVATGLQFISALGFAADGKTVAAVGFNNAIGVWDVATGKATKTPAGGVQAGIFTPGTAATFSPDLKYLAVQSFDTGNQAFTVKVAEVATGKEMPEIKAPVGGAQRLEFTPDGKTLAVGSVAHGEVQFYDVVSGKETRTVGGVAKFDRPLNALAFSPDGATLALGRDGGTLEIWDIAKNEQRHKIGEAAPAGGKMFLVRVVGIGNSSGPALTFAPDGRTVAASLGGTGLRLFDTATGKEATNAAVGHSSAVTGLALGGSTLLTHGRGDPVRLWDVREGKSVGAVALPAGTSHVGLSADGRRLAALTTGAVRVLETSGKEVRKIDIGGDGAAALALSPDGGILAVRDAMSPDIRLYDVATGKELRLISPPVEAARGNGVVVLQVSGITGGDLVFTPDGRRLAGAGGKRQLCLWDIGTGEQVWEAALTQNQHIDRIAFSPDGRTLAARDTDGTVALYETATGERRAALGKVDKDAPAPAFQAFAFGGAVAALGIDGPAPTNAVAFAPDGRLVAAAFGKASVRVWDVRTGEEVAQLDGHEGGVTSLLFTPDGKRLVSGSRDTTAIVWDVAGRAKAPTPAKDNLDAAALEALWSDLGGRDTEKAFAAVRKLAGRPRESAAFLAGRLKPAEAPDIEKIKKAIADLENDEFAVRQRAESDLEKAGDFAEAELRKVLGGEPSLELKQRAERLLRKLGGQALTGTRLQELRAVEALETLGGEGKVALERLAQGAPGARLTREAQAALKRIN